MIAGRLNNKPGGLSLPLTPEGRRDTVRPMPTTMIITSTKKYAERFGSATVLEVEDAPFNGGGAGTDGTDGYVTVPLSRNEGYKDRMYTLRLSREEALRLITRLEDCLTRLDGLESHNAHNARLTAQKK